MYELTGAAPPTPTARASTMNCATWLAATKPSVQLPSRPTARTASCLGWKRGRSERLARRRLGMSSAAWTATPAVVPRPSSTSCPVWSWTVARVGTPAMWWNHSRTKMQTTLLAMAVHIGATNRRRVFKRAVARLMQP